MVQSPKLLLALVGVSWLVAGPALAEGDPAKGRKVFARCKACHVVDSEKNRLGPHLVGIVGRDAASVADFSYSPALQEAEIVWNETTLDQWLTNPKGFLPGNRMTYPGLKKADDREDLIAFLREPITE
jgi:cytochrome c